MSSNLDTALAYGRAGIKVFPVSANKVPLIKDWGNKATTELDQIEFWWTRWPHADIGMPTGSRSGYDIVDIDVKHGKNGYRHLPDWRSLTPVIAQSPTGGANLFFSASGIRNSVDAIALGVDTRGDGGFVVLPAPGNGREWIAGEVPAMGLPPVPEDLRPEGKARKCEPPPVWLIEKVKGHEGKGVSTAADDLPLPLDLNKLATALAIIPNDGIGLGWEEWNRIGMALWRATDGDGFQLFDDFSRRSDKYGAVETRKRWRSYFTSPPNRIGAGSIFYLASQAAPARRERRSRWTSRRG